MKPMETVANEVGITWREERERDIALRWNAIGDRAQFVN